MFPKTSSYVKRYDGEFTRIEFLIKNDDLSKNYKDIWNKVSNSIKKELNYEHIYNKKNLKTEKSSYTDEAEDFNTRKHLKKALIIFVDY